MSGPGFRFRLGPFDHRDQYPADLNFRVGLCDNSPYPLGNFGNSLYSLRNFGNSLYCSVDAMKVEEGDLLNLFDNTVVDRYWKLLPLKEKKESKIIILDR